MMKIEVNDTIKTMRLDQISDGSVFEHKGAYFLKTDEGYVQLKTGICNFDQLEENLSVCLVNATITIN